MLQALKFPVCLLLLALYVTVARAETVISQETLDQTIRVYCEAWSEPDPQKRKALLEESFAEGGTYTDPRSHVENRAALHQLIGGFLDKFKGAKIVPISHGDMHHGLLRFTWRFVNGEGKVVNEGIDFGAIGGDGKLTKIVGFFGQVKPL